MFFLIPLFEEKRLDSRVTHYRRIIGRTLNVKRQNNTPKIGGREEEEKSGFCVDVLSLSDV